MTLKPCLDHKLPMTQQPTKRVGCTRWICLDGCVWFHSTENDLWFQTSHKKRGDIKIGCQIRVSKNGRAVLAAHGYTPQGGIDAFIAGLKKKER